MGFTFAFSGFSVSEPGEPAGAVSLVSTDSAFTPGQPTNPHVSFATNPKSGLMMASASPQPSSRLTASGCNIVSR